MAAAVAAAWLTSGCRVEVDVAIEPDPAGGGEVRVDADLDADAVAQLGGETPEKRLALTDLAEAGWKVTGPDRRPDGGLVVGARHTFDDEAEAKRLVADLAGEAGPFRSFELDQQRTFLKTTTRFGGVLDLRAGLGAFSDPDLAQALAGPKGEPLGVDDGQLERRFGAPVDQLFGLEVSALLPGRVESNTSGDRATGAPRWAGVYGQEVPMSASSESWNVRNIGSLATAVAASAALVVTLVTRRRRRRAEAG